MKIGKHEFDNKRLIIAGIGIVSAVVCFQGYLHLKLYQPDHQYYKQLFAVLSAAALLIGLWNLRKAFPKTVRESIIRGIAKGYDFFAKKIEQFNAKIRKALGLPEKGKRVRGKDERSFIFDLEDDGRFKSFKRGGERLSWRSLESNDEKIRFLFIKFIIKFRKKGYYYNLMMTPNQVGEKWKMPEEEGGIMFPLYTFARYSGGRRPITDDEVELSQKIAK